METFTPEIIFFILYDNARTIFSIAAAIIASTGTLALICDLKTKNQPVMKPKKG